MLQHTLLSADNLMTLLVVVIMVAAVDLPRRGRRCLAGVIATW